MLASVGLLLSQRDFLIRLSEENDNKSGEGETKPSEENKTNSLSEYGTKPFAEGETEPFLEDEINPSGEDESETSRKNDTNPSDENRVTEGDEEESDDPYANFVVIYRSYVCDESNPRLVLQDSADFCGFDLDFSEDKTQKRPGYGYSVKFEGLPIDFPYAYGITKSDARTKAAELALPILKQYCYTVKYKAHKEVSLADILDSIDQSALPLSEQPFEDETALPENVSDTVIAWPDSTEMDTRDLQATTETDPRETFSYRTFVPPFKYPTPEFFSSQVDPRYGEPFRCPTPEMLSSQVDPRYDEPFRRPTPEILSSQVDPRYSDPFRRPTPEILSSQVDPRYGEPFRRPPPEFLSSQADRRYGEPFRRSTPEILSSQVHAKYGDYRVNDTLQSEPSRMSSTFIQPDSLASRMMKLMGWRGGGLGKDSSGITEPIGVSQVKGRFGFGHKKRKDCNKMDQSQKKQKKENNGQNKQPPTSFEKEEKVDIDLVTEEDFENGVHSVINYFMEKSQDHELVFSRELSNAQRKIIHEIASEYDLSSISFGQNKRRHLVLFWETNVHDYLDRLEEEAERCSEPNFEIIKPSAL